MIYNGAKIGSQTILVNYIIPIDSPYFLGVITPPFSSSKNIIFSSVECDDQKDLDTTPDRYYRLTFEGVAEVYEDLTNADVYFPNMGTYDVALYYQASSTNTDPANATLLETFQLQIDG